MRSLFGGTNYYLIHTIAYLFISANKFSYRYDNLCMSMKYRQYSSLM
uniref:Uncharacterized protein n=1 Tax=Alteromonadaceae bacterium PE-TB08W TaxID=1199097 RepID=A0A3G9DXF9_9ALTE|nr:hypothetical protein (truncated) [Alteromonadaceae bacterium PE-TB08W]